MFEIIDPQRIIYRSTFWFCLVYLLMSSLSHLCFFLFELFEMRSTLHENVEHTYHGIKNPTTKYAETKVITQSKKTNAIADDDQKHLIEKKLGFSFTVEVIHYLPIKPNKMNSKEKSSAICYKHHDRIWYEDHNVDESIRSNHRHIFH